MLLPFHGEIFFYRKPIDFRRGIDGLCILIADTLAQNPTSGKIFVFRNRGRDRLKILYYDQNGFWLLYRRMNGRFFTFPSVGDDEMTITPEQLQWLLSGLDIEKHHAKPNKQYQYFF